jgi:poly-gamma-glutamate synthesis protein (capsule biosynthesis protein)
VVLATVGAACSGDDGDRVETADGAGAPTSGPSSSTTTAEPPPTTVPTTSAAATTSTEAATSTTEAAPTDTAGTQPEPESEAAAGTTGGEAAAPAGPFAFEVSAITPELAARMTPTSWREGCPVPLADLRYLRVSHWDFDGGVQPGELVVHADVVADLQAVFVQLFEAGFPIRRMRLVDDYGGDDFTSIEAGNTSAFNCRSATGSANWSQHAYGRAIDVNPLENPYVSGGSTEHAESVPYLDRTPRPGMATEGGVLVAAFDAVGWDWGGRWSAPVDYQHFSSTGG